jgi:hypothetical protein
LEKVHENVESSLAPKLRKMRDKAWITITGTQRNRTQREERVEECRKKRLGGMSLAIVGSD